MLYNRLFRKGFALVGALLAVVCVVALLSIGLASPEPVSNAALGPDWQCTRVAFVLTTCTRIAHAEPTTVGVRDQKPCPRAGK
jgi:hypothetical protein